MYLREMGGVELLSREGEIAIAKRIEAGKDVMLNALSQSPITATQLFEWNEKLQKDEILVREIIDIDTNYMEEENSSQEMKEKKMMIKKIKLKKMIKMNKANKRLKKMSSILLLLLWKVKLNQKF